MVLHINYSNTTVIYRCFLNGKNFIYIKEYHTNMPITTESGNVVLSPEQIESYIAEILGEFKQATYRGYQWNYTDYEIRFRDYGIEGDPVVEYYLNSGIKSDPPEFTYWPTYLVLICEPIYQILYQRQYGEAPPKREYSFKHLIKETDKTKKDLIKKVYA